MKRTPWAARTGGGAMGAATRLYKGAETTEDRVNHRDTKDTEKTKERRVFDNSCLLSPAARGHSLCLGGSSCLLLRGADEPRLRGRVRLEEREQLARDLLLPGGRRVR